MNKYGKKEKIGSWSIHANGCKKGVLSEEKFDRERKKIKKKIKNAGQYGQITTRTLGVEYKII